MYIKKELTAGIVNKYLKKFPYINFKTHKVPTKKGPSVSDTRLLTWDGGFKKTTIMFF